MYIRTCIIRVVPGTRDRGIRHSLFGRASLDPIRHLTAVSVKSILRIQYKYTRYLVPARILGMIYRYIVVLVSRLMFSFFAM